MSNNNSHKKSAQKPGKQKASSTSTCLYRVLGYQPLSVDMVAQTLKGLSIQKPPCSFKPVDLSWQLNLRLSLTPTLSPLPDEVSRY